MKKIYIFSYGLHPGHLTLEALAAMKSCGVVYTHCLDAATAGFFLRMAPDLRLNTGLDRRETAAAAAAALRRHDKVGFLTYGNPFFLNQAAAEVVSAAEAAGAAVEVLPAVSSFDSLVNLFGLNKFSSCGLRLVDAASALDKPRFTPEMDTLVFVPDVLNLAVNAPARKKFLAAAARAYQPASPAYLAECASISGLKPRVLNGTVGGLGRLLGKVTERSTLFIPAASGPRRPGKKRPPVKK